MADRPSGRRALPVLTNNSARAIGAVGVAACTLCCLSIPGIAAVLSATGLAFLRNDRILLPGTIIFAALVIVTFFRARAMHGRQAPLLLAVGAVALTIVGLRSSGWLATGLVSSGVVALLVLMVWDARLQRRCRV
jgi:hypothetical protein